MKTPSKSKRKAPSNYFALDQLSVERSKRQLLRDAIRPNEERDVAFRRMILSIPAGKVSTYSVVAAAAGYPRYHRAVARLLRTDPVDHLPWHRVVGAGGEIKLQGAAEYEQRARLKLEGVQFDGKRIDMERFEHSFETWEVYR
ncbi:cysteine methyltransferase [Granulicella sp. WH15]|uniref:MGMT family protein n=1 Tax=Granulicella sp. WH15 TaxID=2602070 RepID=UPI00136747A0|nr:MGMT family protein [Granulicella sp. WH15]QHN03578.1 cysteine methyltransferase [Granulicella sp. WH15]